MIKNYKLEIAYDGSSFSGWQIQKNANTIQDSIESALKKIMKIDNINLIGSGRTDAGVHANNQCANVLLDTKMTCEQIKKAINSKLSNNILIKNCIEVNLEFNSRFSAKRREYIYYITDDFSPMNRYFFWQNKRKLNKDKLEKCAAMIIGEYDFSLFSKASSETKNKICTIYQSSWKFENKFISYKIAGNRFLHHMVRLLVGTMVEVSIGTLSLDQFSSLLKLEKIKASAVRAPARGLFLNKIHYE
jgi:tRNA pseudouridine38-40 synthase